MGYSIMFFGMDGEAFARQLREAPEALVGKVRQKSSLDNAGAQLLLDICGGNFPMGCDLDYFYGLCWLADAVAERITICPFQDFRHLSYLDDIGIWPWLQRYPPPFPVPRCDEETPSVGYLPVEGIEAFALPAFEQLPPSQDRDVVNARDEFRDVLETLVPDRLDLLAVLI